MNVERFVNGKSIRPLLLVLLAAGVVRGYLFFATSVISKDGVYYIGKAQLIAQGAWRQTVTDSLEPVFPYSIYLFHHLVPDWEIAGMVASLTWGVLSVIPFFLLARDLFGLRVAFWSGLFFSLHPYFAWNAADVLTESSYIFFFLLSLWLALVALTRSGMGWHLLSAGAIVLARLSRTEGIWACAVILVFYGIRCWRDPHLRGWHRVAPLVRFSVAFGLMLLPLLVYGKDIAGTAELSAYKGLGWAAYVFGQLQAAIQQRVGELADYTAIRRFAGLVGHYYVYKFIMAFNPLLFLLAAYAVLQRSVRREYRDQLFLTASVWVIYLGGVFFAGFIRGIEETSRRFMMAPVAVALPWAAVGMDAVAVRFQRSGWAARLRAVMPKMMWRLTERDADWRWPVCATVTVVLASITIQPHRLDKLPIREAAAWIHAQEVKNPLIITHDSRIGFYANAEMVFVRDTLEGKTADEQGRMIRDILQGANSRRVNFIFLKGALYTKSQKSIHAFGAVQEIREWRSSYGGVYTLIWLRDGV